MKQFIKLILIVLVLCGYTSCSDKNEEQTSESLLGIWYTESGERLEFFEDNTLTSFRSQINISGKWILLSDGRYKVDVNQSGVTSTQVFRAAFQSSDTVKIVTEGKPPTIWVSKDLWANISTERENRVRYDFKQLEQSLKDYESVTGQYPSQLQGLIALVERPISPPRPKQWKQILPKLPSDPWGAPYLYKYPGTKNRDMPEIISNGNDGVERTPDDYSSQDGHKSEEVTGKASDSKSINRN